MRPGLGAQFRCDIIGFVTLDRREVPRVIKAGAAGDHVDDERSRSVLLPRASPVAADQSIAWYRVPVCFPMPAVVTEGFSVDDLVAILSAFGVPIDHTILRMHMQRLGANGRLPYNAVSAKAHSLERTCLTHRADSGVRITSRYCQNEQLPASPSQAVPS